MQCHNNDHPGFISKLRWLFAKLCRRNQSLCKRVLQQCDNDDYHLHPGSHAVHRCLGWSRQLPWCWGNLVGHLEAGPGTPRSQPGRLPTCQRHGRLHARWLDPRPCRLVDGRKRTSDGETWFSPNLWTLHCHWGKRDSGKLIFCACFSNDQKYTVALRRRTYVTELNMKRCNISLAGRLDSWRWRMGFEWRSQASWRYTPTVPVCQIPARAGRFPRKRRPVSVSCYSWWNDAERQWVQETRLLGYICPCSRVFHVGIKFPNKQMFLLPSENLLHYVLLMSMCKLHILF